MIVLFLAQAILANYIYTPRPLKGEIWRRSFESDYPKIKTVSIKLTV